MIKTEENLFIIDTMALAYRCYFAYPDLKSSDGTPTSVIYGVKKFLDFIYSLNECDHIIFANESGSNFRKEIHPEYKSGRREKDPEFVEQLQDLKDFLSILKLNPVVVDNYEADDIIGSLVEKYKKVYRCSIVSPDKDFMQLVDDRVTLIRPHKFPKIERFDANAVREKLGISPDQVIDYLAIVGDTADNIPGVRGVGPKGAEKLIKSYNNLEGIYSALPAIHSSSKSTGDKLQKSHDSAFMSKTLATIVRDVEIPGEFSPVWMHDLMLKDMQKTEVTNFLSSLDIKT